VLVVTNDPKQMRDVVGGDASISNMSNLLNEFKLSADRMKPIKIKSIIFDNKGGNQIREPERGYSIVEQMTVLSEKGMSPKIKKE